MIGARLLSVGYPGVRGLSVPITQGKTLRVSVTFQNTGNVTLDSAAVAVYVGDSLSAPTGDVEQDNWTWGNEKETSGFGFGPTNMAPGETATVNVDIDTTNMSEGTKDVAVVLSITYQGTGYYIDEYYESDAITIQIPEIPAAEIVSVSYEEV